jgi:subtilisin family serine protease
VKFSGSMTASQREAALSIKKFTRIRRFDALSTELVRVPPGLAVAAAVGGLKSLAGVLTVQPNYLRYAVQSAPPNDQYWLEGRMWGLERIKAQSVWNAFTRGDDRVVVASLDTGINYRHPDLAANMWRNPLEIPGNGLDDDGDGYVDDVYGIDARNHTGDPLDDHGHGTLTAGTIAAVGNNSEGTVGVTWNTKLLACKFLGPDGIGTDAGAIECFNYIVSLRNRGVNIRVSSNGWGAARGDGPAAGALEAAIEAAGAAGILNIFGAGNDGKDIDREPFDPASFGASSVVSCDIVDRNDFRSTFGNYGATSVDLAAPGEDILTTYQSAYASASGSSLAAAHVAGTAALLAGLDPSLSAGWHQGPAAQDRRSVPAMDRSRRVRRPPECVSRGGRGGHRSQ